MKTSKYLLFVLFLLVGSSSFSQHFSPQNFLLNDVSESRVTKSHIPADSIILSSVSQQVDLEDETLPWLISTMYRTVTDSLSRGVGIAAPQVGVNKRVILVQRFDKSNEPFEAYINPTIAQYSILKENRKEGCLSVDGIRCEVQRPYAILVSYFTVEGVYRIEMIEGFTARIFQHEIDHLNGILFTQRAEKGN